MASQFNSSNRNTMFPGSDDSQLVIDAAWKSPEGPTETIIELPPAKRPRPSSASTRYPVKIPPSHLEQFSRRVSIAPVITGSPWEPYEKEWCLGLNGSVDVAYNKSREDKLYTVRGISESNAEEKVAIVRQLHDKNLVPIHEIFKFQQEFFIISPYLDISLEGINGCPRYPNELQLAALSHEILSGISYLASQGLTHGEIKCSNVLLSLRGEVKITNIEYCRKSVEGDAGRTDIKALGDVIITVMEKDSQPKGSFGIQHPERWSQDAVDFVSMTEFSTASKLAQHIFVMNHQRHGSLVRLVEFAKTAAFKLYNYEKSAEFF